MSFEKLCRVGSKAPLPHYAPKDTKEKLAKACGFLSPSMKLSPESVVSTAYLIGIFTLIGSVVILSLAGVLWILVTLISVLLTLLSFYAIVYYPISLMNQHKLMLSEQSDLMFEQFALVYQAGGTIFDAIEMIAKSEHPYLSKAFQRILGEIQKGVSPERALMNFANNQPSQDMRRYIITILSATERDVDLLDMVSGESYEADMTLRQKNLELESRLLVTTALLTYLPIVAVLALSLNGAAENPLVILLFPAFSVLALLLRKRFSNRYSTYFDTPRETGLGQPSQNQVIEEYDEFLNFLILLGERLSLGDTLEVALFEVRDDIGKEVQRLLDPALECLNSKNCSLEEALSKASDKALGVRVAQILNLLWLMVASSARDAGVRIRKIATRLVERSEVAKERDTIIAAQRLKVYILSLTSALVLGFLTSLAPFLSLASLLSNNQGIVPHSKSIIDMYPLLAAVGLTTAFTALQSTKMVGGEHPKLIAFLSITIYLLSLTFAGAFIGLSFSLE
ncbi:hypothetical protein EU537_10795 [Candidatus Thorarchaeota archaeon]|nr:MAG: hypothetical protein EU537_10795 [Candidatus Thorarchaeota archaeon]